MTDRSKPTIVPNRGRSKAKGRLHSEKTGAGANTPRSFNSAARSERNNRALSVLNARHNRTRILAAIAAHRIPRMHRAAAPLTKAPLARYLIQLNTPTQIQAQSPRCTTHCQSHCSESIAVVHCCAVKGRSRHQQSPYHVSNPPQGRVKYATPTFRQTAFR